MGEATELSTLLRDFSAFMRRGGNLNYSMNGLRLEDALLEAANKLALPDESGKLREALEKLIFTSRVLLQNAEGCAANHYGNDMETHGPPGWLADCANVIEEARRVKDTPNEE